MSRGAFGCRIGFMVLNLLWLGVGMVVSGYVSHLLLKLLSYILAIPIRVLGIKSEVGVGLLLLSIFGYWISLPIYIRTSPPTNLINYFPRLLSDWLKVRGMSNDQGFIVIVLSRWRINLVGGVAPIALALYQFSRNSTGSILATMTVVASMSYFFLSMTPRSTYLKWHHFYMVILAAVCTAFLTSSPEASYLIPATAFSGGVLGALIGVDLLHFRRADSLSFGEVKVIGGARSRFAISSCGLHSLFLAEFLLHGVDFS